MSQDNTGGGGPVATAQPGTPIYVSVQSPSDQPAEKPATKKEAKKIERKVEKAAARAEEKGARNVLKSLGISKDERDGLLKEIKETRTAKSLQEKITGEHKARADKAETELKALKSQFETYESLAKAYADDQFNALPEPMQKFIAATAGEDLNARLKAIKTAKEAGLITAKEAAAANAQVKAEEKPAKPANTSNATNPKATPATQTLTPRQRWEQMKATNPRLAAQYYAANQIAIDSDWS